VTHNREVLPDQSLTSRSEARTACNFSDELYGAGRSKDTGTVLSPEMMFIVVNKLKAAKADGVGVSGRQQC